MNRVPIADHKGPSWFEGEDVTATIGLIKCTDTSVGYSEHGDRCVLTTHRLFWRMAAEPPNADDRKNADSEGNAKWTEIDLRRIRGVAIHRRLFRNPKVEVSIDDPCTNRVQHVLQIRVDHERFQEVLRLLHNAIATEPWKAGSYSVAKSAGGIGRLLKQHKEEKYARTAILESAMADLEVLRQNADEMVKVARALRRNAAPDASSGQDSAVNRLYRDYGLLDVADGSAGDAHDPYFDNAAHIIAKLLAQVLPEDSFDWLSSLAANNRGDLSPGGSPLSLNSAPQSVPSTPDQQQQQQSLNSSPGFRSVNGFILLHELYCLYNRIPGANLLSPQDFLMTLKRLTENPKSLYTLKMIDRGQLIGIQLRSAAASRFASRLTAILREQEGRRPNQQPPDFASISAAQLASHSGASVCLATVQLQEAEKLGYLCREESIAGVRFYVNHMSPDDGATTLSA